MTGAMTDILGRRQFLTLASLFGAALVQGLPPVEAHNNPGFKEVLLLTIEVSAEPVTEEPLSAHSEPFSLDLPKKTIELIWRVSDGAAETINFSVAQGDALHAEGLTDGANSRILRGGDVRIVEVGGATGPFSIEIYANVIDRSNPAAG